MYIAIYVCLFMYIYLLAEDYIYILRMEWQLVILELSSPLWLGGQPPLRLLMSVFLSLSSLLFSLSMTIRAEVPEIMSHVSVNSYQPSAFPRDILPGMGLT